MRGALEGGEVGWDSFGVQNVMQSWPDEAPRGLIDDEMCPGVVTRAGVGSVRVCEVCCGVLE